MFRSRGRSIGQSLHSVEEEDEEDILDIQQEEMLIIGSSSRKKIWRRSPIQRMDYSTIRRSLITSSSPRQRGAGHGLMSHHILIQDNRPNDNAFRTLLSRFSLLVNRHSFWCIEAFLTYHVIRISWPNP